MQQQRLATVRDDDFAARRWWCDDDAACRCVRRFLIGADRTCAAADRVARRVADTRETELVREIERGCATLADRPRRVDDDRKRETRDAKHQALDRRANER